MRSFRWTIVLPFGAFAAIGTNNLQRRNCHANNCARQITGTGAHITPDLTARLADCSSYMTAVLNPSAISATNTQPVPLYATPFCSDAAEYSSVCSCAGVKETTITVATSTAPEFSTYTFTTTVTSLIGGGSLGSSGDSTSASSSTASSSPTTTTQDTASSTSSTTTQDSTADGTTVGSGAGAGASTTISTTSSTTTACPSGRAQCSADTCNDLQTDEQNCGQCGTVCTSTDICYLGNCTSLLDISSRCDSPAFCDKADQFACQPGCAGTRGYCQPDVTGQGRCRSESSNPECVNQTVCATNAECPGGYCIQSCCATPTCYFFQDTSFCTNATTSNIPKRDLSWRGPDSGLPF
ncbi:hypothetical protein GLAREA_01735 [Glarea lozoyensis ATCC 20868]|uniref:Uncharacterized protein n=1 Tax=Glarea lozoyensis (strain ATCC 20868 / MF5171) TaxID=1116229 RepID=S3DGX3_GLAL2|nr:uncharacterized protein GLAREA_01735 [Glarea lozoyensis ATCC 20868]EPE25823.1 hypothetical protein GLAREA_01735 [Glarea lozoyensis ATCC 20868]